LSSANKVKIVRSIKKDSKDNLWIGTDGFGLFELQYPNSKEPIVKNYMYNSQLASSIAGNALTFFLFGAVALLGFFILLKILPETKGKSLEELEREFIKDYYEN
jgi:hypothetical protein